MNLQIYTDGGSRGNPGPAGIGVVVIDKGTGRVLEETAVYLGGATNNQAEYKAAITGLQKALELGARTVELISDSELMIKQAKGVYKVKNADLAKHYLELKNLETQLGGRVQYHHVKREHNQKADALANQAMDRGE